MRIKAVRHTKEGQSVGIWLATDVVERADKIAVKAGITRSKLMANMIEMATESLEKADSFGILSMALLMRDFEESLRGWIRSVRDEGKGIKEDWDNGAIEETTFANLGR